MGIDTSKRGSSLGGFLNFFKSLFGAGILSLANAFSTTGLAPAVLVFAFVAVTCYGTMMMLLHCKDVASKRAKKELLSYGEVAGFVFGPRGYKFAELSIAILEMVFCCGFLIVLTEELHNVYKPISMAGWAWICFPVLAVLALIPNMQNLWFTSLLGLLVYLFGVMGVTFYNASTDYDQPSELYQWRFQGFAHVFGTAIYSMEGIGLVIPVSASMAKPEEAPMVIGLSLAVYCVLSATYAGYAFAAGYGDCDVITECLKEGAATTTVRITLAIALIFTQPVHLIVPSTIFENFLFPDHDDNRKHKVNALRVLEVAFTCTIASLNIPFSIFSSFAGCTILVFVGFILPVYVYWGLYQPRPAHYHFPLSRIVSLLKIPTAHEHVREGTESQALNLQMATSLLNNVADLEAEGTAVDERPISETMMWTTIVILLVGIAAMIIGLYETIAELV